MDFNTGQRSQQPLNRPGNQGASAPGNGQQDRQQKGNSKGFSRIKNKPLMSIVNIALLFSLTVLIIGVIFYIFLFDANKEEEFVAKDRYQAVFLNGGQVYFGKIQNINKEYMTLTDIYYLQVTQQVQPDKTQSNNFTLAKLGCELHRPQDSMVINKDQIIFWENLKDEDAQNSVTGAIKAYQKSNQPADCEQRQQPAANQPKKDDATPPAADENNAPAEENNAPATETEGNTPSSNGGTDTTDTNNPNN